MIASVLPYCAAMWLVEASKAATAGSIERRIAIDEAIKKCRSTFPEFFRAETSGRKVD